MLRYLFIIFIFLATTHLAAQDHNKVTQLRKALISYDKALKMKRESLSLRDSVKVNLLISLASEVYENNPKEAFNYLNQSIAISKAIGFNRRFGDIYNIMGVVNDAYSNYKEALRNYQYALRYFNQTKDLGGQLRTNYNIGVLYGKQSNFPQALTFMFKGLEIAKSIKDDEGLLGGYNNLGVLYTDQGNYELSLKYYINALSILKKLNNTYYMGVLSQNIGDIYLIQKNYRKAEIYFEQGLKQSVASKNQLAEANNYDGFGRSYLKQGRYNEAIENLEKALKIRIALENNYGIADSYISLGDALMKTNQPDKAKASLERGLALVRKSGELSLERNAYEHLSEVSRSLGDYKKAYEYQALFKRTTDSIFNNEKDRKIVQIQLGHEFKSKQDSLKAVQQKKSDLLMEEAREQRETRNFIYIVLGLVVIFLIILLWQYRHIAKVKRQQVLDEQRNRISRDLHDNLGAQLSAARMFMVSLTDSNPENVPQIAENSISLLDASIADLRNVMDDMQDTVLIQNGYLAATEALINKVNKLKGIEFSLTHHKMEQRPNERLEHHLYRITQELINNTLKYSHAKNVSIDLLRSDDSIVLMYEDDGIGYDPKTVKKGYGLKNIETRIKSLGGKVNFDSMPDMGARTTIEIPQ